MSSMTFKMRLRSLRMRSKNDNSRVVMDDDEGINITLFVNVYLCL